MKKLIAFGIILAVVSGLLCSPASAGEKLRENEKLLEGPPTTEIVDAYDGALRCLSEKLTKEQKDMVYGIAFFADKTGRTNIAAPDASGTFIAQDYSDALTTALKKTGVRVTNIGPAFKSTIQWMAQQKNMSPADIKALGILYPDLMLEGGFDVLDIGGGKVGEFTGVLRGGRREYRILLGFDAHSTVMSSEKIVASVGEEIAPFGYTKQVVGIEDQFGLTSFFGGGTVRSILGFNLDKDQRQPLQFAARSMMSVVAYRTVRDISRQTGCDQEFQMAETAANVSTLARRK